MLSLIPAVFFMHAVTSLREVLKVRCNKIRKAGTCANTCPKSSITCQAVRGPGSLTAQGNRHPLRDGDAGYENRRPDARHSQDNGNQSGSPNKQEVCRA